MGILSSIAAFFKMFSLLLNLYQEKDKKKAEETAELTKEIVDAFKQTNKKLRASRINSIVSKLRK